MKSLIGLITGIWNTSFSQKNGINFNIFSVLCIWGPPQGHGICEGVICTTDFDITIVAEVLACNFSSLERKVEGRSVNAELGEVNQVSSF